MNRTHSHLRRRLGVEKLDDFMCISKLGPKSIKDFDWPILTQWLEAPFLGKNGRGLYFKREAKWRHARAPRLKEGWEGSEEIRAKRALIWRSQKSEEI
jgi:hypothetical protein